MTTTFWLIRHAPVVDAPQIYGSTDVDCDCSRVEAFEGLAGRLPAKAVSLVTTPLKRTHLTAEAIRRAGLALPAPIARADLAEQHMGDWEGGAWDACAPRDAPFWQAPHSSRPPNGESFEDVVARVGAALDDMAELFAGREVVCVLHAGVIRAALCAVMGVPVERGLHWLVAPLSLTVLKKMGETWVAERVNEPPC